MIGAGATYIGDIAIALFSYMVLEMDDYLV